MSLVLPVSAPAPRANFLPLKIAFFCVVWSLAFPVAKLAVADCPPLIMLVFRFLLAGLVMLGLSAFRSGEMSLTRRDVAAFALIGIANNAMFLGLGYLGLRTVSAGLGTLVISANPVLTAVLAAMFLGERLTWQKVVGLLLGVGGVLYIVEHRLINGLGHDAPAGLIFTFASLLSIVGGTILYKKFAPKGGMMIGNAVQNIAGGLVLTPFAFATESVADIVPGWRLVAAVGYLTILGSIVGYLLWQYLIRTMGATAASSYHFLMPPLGVLFSWILLGEHITLQDVLGIVPVVAGIYLVTRAVAPVVPKLQQE